jgi:hypothetical protein
MSEESAQYRNMLADGLTSGRARIERNQSSLAIDNGDVSRACQSQISQNSGEFVVGMGLKPTCPREHAEA